MRNIYKKYDTYYELLVKYKNDYVTAYIDTEDYEIVSNHKMCTKSFSCNKYGYDEAKQMAIDFRLSMMKENEYMYDKEMYGESSETIESI